MAAPTRTCHLCRSDKPISGVWYLLATIGGGQVASFACESCFRGERA